MCFQPPPIPVSQPSPCGAAGLIPARLANTPPTPPTVSSTAHTSPPGLQLTLSTPPQTCSSTVFSGGQWYQR